MILEFHRVLGTQRIHLARLLLAVCMIVCMAGAPRAGMQVQAAAAYQVKVNVAANTVTVYQNGQPVRAMVCSTGGATPKKGTFRLGERYRWRVLFYGVCGQYATRITGNILFHSVPYLKMNDPSSLEWEEYDKLGTKASAGCVRLAVADAKWIYENCPAGTEVTFYQDANDPGPLGKPYTVDIAGASSRYRGWDPTDPAQNNPWNELTGAAFDADYYYDHNPDLQQYVGSDPEALRLHWLGYGIPEGRRASEGLDLAALKSRRPDLVQAFGSNNYAYVRWYNTQH